jgi:hypothetical protein
VAKLLEENNLLKKKLAFAHQRQNQIIELIQSTIGKINSEETSLIATLKEDLILTDSTSKVATSPPPVEESQTATTAAIRTGPSNERQDQIHVKTKKSASVPTLAPEDISQLDDASSKSEDAETRRKRSRHQMEQSSSHSQNSSKSRLEDTKAQNSEKSRGVSINGESSPKMVRLSPDSSSSREHSPEKSSKPSTSARKLSFSGRNSTPISPRSGSRSISPRRRFSPRRPDVGFRSRSRSRSRSRIRDRSGSIQRSRSPSPKKQQLPREWPSEILAPISGFVGKLTHLRERTTSFMSFESQLCQRYGFCSVRTIPQLGPNVIFKDSQSLQYLIADSKETALRHGFGSLRIQILLGTHLLILPRL